MTPQPLPERWIEKMFDKMLLDYGKKFTDQWGGADTGALIAHWSREMASYTGPEIKRGLAAMEGRDWPPTLPEFKKLCRPPVDPLVSYYQAVEGMSARERGEVGRWTHPAIFWAAVAVGAYDLKHQSYSQMKARWELALQDQMEKGEWEAVPQPMIALPAPGKSLTSKQEATRMLEQLGASDTLKLRSDHRAWIPKVLQRAEKGDDSLPPIALRFAREAMTAPGPK
jgi:hypothetical protein